MNNKGFISIIGLLIMALILISSTFLIYMSNMEYLILNGNKNNMQSYYSGEGKILRLLYQDKYYYNEVLPRIKRYLKFGFLGENYSKKISIDEKDLMEGDIYKNVEVSFLTEDNRAIMTFNTKTIFNGITKEIQSKINIVKDFYELGNPILYDHILSKEKRQEYIVYMDYLEKKIGLNQLDNDIMGIESIDFDNIIISKDLNNKKYIEFYRNNLDNPIKYEYINKNKIFLLIRGNTNLWFKSQENNDKLIINGVIYTEGDININNDIDFNGILILNKGKINLSPDTKFKFQGIILSRYYPYGNQDFSKEIEVEYNEKNIRTNGIYLPNYIEPKIKVLQAL